MTERKDIVTNERFDRSELIRISVQKDGSTTIDHSLNGKGRGIYVHPTNLKVALDRNVIKGQVKRFKGDFTKIELELKELING